MKTLLTILLTSLCAPAADNSGFEAWVAAAGGFTGKDATGALTAVSLRGAWLTGSDIGRLAEFSSIRRLDLSLTHINDRALEPLQRLPNLEELNLTYAEHITDAGLARLRNVKSLQKLDLEGTKVTDSGVSSLAGLPKLRSINLRSTQVTDSALEHLEPLANLEELRIGGNRIAGFGLTFLQALPGIKRLDLSGAQLTDDGIWSVALTDLNIDTLAALQKLESLNLAAAELPGTKVIPDGGIRESATLHITGLGLAKLKGLKRLRALDLTRSEIGAEGVMALSEFPKLEHLVLAHAPRVDDSAIPALLQLKELRTLDLSGTKVTSEGIAALRRDRPGCQITTSQPRHRN